MRQKKEENGDVGDVGKVKPNSSAAGLIDASGLADASSIIGASEGVGGLILLIVTRGKRIVLKRATTLEIRLRTPLNHADPHRHTQRLNRRTSGLAVPATLDIRRPAANEIRIMSKALQPGFSPGGKIPR